MPTLAVIIPAKNEEVFLPVLLSALREQTLQPDEVIVADAQSTDKTREIAQAFGARVIEGGMPGAGRNRGAEVAASELLLFLDADVTLMGKDFLEKATREFFERKLQIATVDVCLPKGKTYDKVSHNAYNAYARLWGKVRPHATGSCMFVLRALHQSVGGFDERIRLSEDHEFASRAAKKGTFGFLNGVKIGLNTRRQELEGRAQLVIKYILAEMHSIALGPIYHDKFRYRFNYDRKILEKEKENISS